jgi:hypothetical protein
MREDFDLEGTLKLFCDFLRDSGFRSYNAKPIPLTRKFNAWLREKHPELSFVASFDMKLVFEAWGDSYYDGSLWCPEECVCTRYGDVVRNFLEISYPKPAFAGLGVMHMDIYWSQLAELM